MSGQKLPTLIEKNQERRNLEFLEWERKKRTPAVRSSETFFGLDEEAKRLDALGLPPELLRVQRDEYDDGVRRLHISLGRTQKTLKDIRALEERLRQSENVSPYSAREFALVSREASLAKHNPEEFLRLLKDQGDDAAAALHEVQAYKASLETRLNELMAVQEVTAQGDDGVLHSS